MGKKINIAYLRKSREDAEAEKRGEGETLARHQKMLEDTARRLGMHIDKYYKEVVSGETISSRPMMQQLLSDVESGLCENVLVVEVERLARGDSLDQGIVSRAFFLSGTHIVTPSKTYDPENEFDEEYFEFSLFMSRREYKTIRRRMERGRVASVKEGKYVGSVAPYGYSRIKLKSDKGYTLEVVPKEAEAVKLIFEWYAHGMPNENGTMVKVGTTAIAQRINSLGYKPRKAERWTPAAVDNILRNYVYTGKIVWNQRKTVKSVKGNVISRTRPRATPELYDGLHPAIVSQSVFDIVLQRLNTYEKPHYFNTIKNPLAGVIICGKCGHTIKCRPAGNRMKGAENYYDTMMCTTIDCPNVSVPFHVLEKRLLETLEQWLKNYELEYPTEFHSDHFIETKKSGLENYNSELKDCIKQRDKIYTLYERGIYADDVFSQRISVVSEAISACEKAIAESQREIDHYYEFEQSRAIFIPKVKRVLELYYQLDDAADKNALLKEVLEKVVYTKAQGGRYSGCIDKFELVLYPKIPNSK